MILDFTERGLFLSKVSLKSHQQSQLRDWGFVADDSENLIYSGKTPDKALVKLVNYFGKQKVEYRTTDNCEVRLASVNQRFNAFSNTKEIGRDFKNGKFNKKEFNEFSEFFKRHLPTRELKEHQLKAAYHLYLVRNGANFSVPGSGKTSVVLSVYEKLREEDKTNVLFVVGPPACFGPWKNEFKETLGRNPHVKILAGGDRQDRKSQYFTNSSNKAELYLTTFQTLINDQQEINTLFQQKGINVFLVIDEAHYIKQVNGNWATAVLNISRHSKYRCILTGTPIPKGFSDIYNLFDFLWPDNDPIESSSRTRLQTLERNDRIDDAKVILDEKIGPLFYRVRKIELGLKPPIFHPPVVLKMNKYEKIIYDAIEQRIRSYSLEDYLPNIDFVNRLKRGRITRLRQSTSYLQLLNRAIENYDENLLKNDRNLQHIVKNYDELELPAKLQYLTSKVKELQKKRQKVVIWTNFVGTIEKLEHHFSVSLGLYARSIYGRTPVEQTAIGDELTREKIRDEFVDEHSGLDILIANPAACAESISLHKTCHHAIYYDLTYNCAQYLQSLDRIHRVGGSEKIVAHYYFLQYENSIDIDILNNVRRKADRMSKIIDQDFRIYSLNLFEDDDDELNAYDRLFGKK